VFGHEWYQKEIEIVTFQASTPDLFTAGATRVISRNEVVRTIARQSDKVILMKV